jgi:hypothetical protein
MVGDGGDDRLLHCADPAGQRDVGGTMTPRGVFWVLSTLFCVSFWLSIGALALEKLGMTSIHQTGIVLVAVLFLTAFMLFGYAVWVSSRRGQQEELWEGQEP